MQLVLSEDQELLAKTAADFASERSPLARVRALRDASDPIGFSRPLWKEMAELGWVGIPFPESLRRRGHGPLGARRRARGARPRARAGALPLQRAARRSGAPARGQRRAAAGVAAAAGRPATRCSRSRNQERESRFDLAARRDARAARRATAGGSRGEKIAVLDGGGADAFVVAARTSGARRRRARASRSSCVPADAPGCAVERQWRVDSRNAAHRRSSRTRASAPTRCSGARARGSRVLEQVVDLATAGLCAEMLGSMSEAFERTLLYLKQPRPVRRADRLASRRSSTAPRRCSSRSSCAAPR